MATTSTPIISETWMPSHMRSLLQASPNHFSVKVKSLWVGMRLSLKASSSR
jgi:hypothetical protein